MSNKKHNLLDHLLFQAEEEMIFKLNRFGRQQNLLCRERPTVD